MLRRGVRLRGVLGMEHKLHQTLAIPEIDEGHAAVVPPAPHPSAEGDALAGVLRPELATRVRPHRRPEMAHRIARALIALQPSPFGRAS